MFSPYSIVILPSNKIDKEKWNACLQNADNNIIYAQYDYLQMIADNWAGVIVNDYEAIMPLPFRSKMGIRYCYHVPFIQQLGLFGTYDETLFKAVVNKAMKYIRYGDLFFNYRNVVSLALPGVKTKENYLLPLSSSYRDIYKNYSRHLQTKLKQAQSKGLFFIVSDYNTKTVSLFQQLYAERLPQIRQNDYARLDKLAAFFFASGQCLVGSVCDSQLKVIATALFFKDENRIYNILPSTTPEGRKLNAMHYLLDNIIQKYAETQYSLDFEGSDVPGVKRFYQSFGAVNQPYFHYHFNRLPFPLRFLKR